MLLHEHDNACSRLCCITLHCVALAQLQKTSGCKTQVALYCKRRTPVLYCIALQDALYCIARRWLYCIALYCKTHCIALYCKTQDTWHHLLSANSHACHPPHPHHPRHPHHPHQHCHRHLPRNMCKLLTGNWKTVGLLFTFHNHVKFSGWLHFLLNCQFCRNCLLNYQVSFWTCSFNQLLQHCSILKKMCWSLQHR